MQQHRVLQQRVLLLLLLLLRALQQHEKVVVHRKPSDRAVGGVEFVSSGYWLFMLVSWAERSCSTESNRENQRQTNN